jgi:uncharacterized membrane protein (UPF0127 family)
LLVNGSPVATVEVADTWRARFRGLLGRRELPEALWLEPESSVHGIGMRVSLDVALLDSAGGVVDTLVLRPWAVTAPRRGVVAVVEAPQGSFERWDLRPGGVVSRGGPGGVAGGS